MITDAMLRTAAGELETALIASLPDPRECSHDFSARFSRRMKKAVYHANHPFISKLGQRAAAVILAILLLGGSILLISPNARAAFVGWVKEVYESCYRYFVPSNPPEDVPEEIPSSYYPSWLPDGTMLLDEFEIDNGTTMIYVDPNGNLLQFSYYINPTASKADLFVETNEHIYVQTTIKGNTADLFISEANGESNALIWSNSSDTVLFLITTQLDSKTLVQIGESVIAGQ